MFNWACRMVEPLAEKIVRPFFFWISIRLTPVVSSTGCKSGVESARKGSLLISPRLRFRYSQD